MKYYASHCGGSHKRVSFLVQNGIGCMISAADFRKPYSFYAIDNGAWTDYTHRESFNHYRFIQVLNRIWTDKLNPDFIVLPDVVRNGKESIKLSKKYMFLTEMFPCYLAVQNGMNPEDIKEYTDCISGIFVGGDNVWKYRYLEEWVNFAHRHELNCHVGKVGTLKDMMSCVNSGADSADGSNLIRNGLSERLIEILNTAHTHAKLDV